MELTYWLLGFMIVCAGVWYRLWLQKAPAVSDEIIRKHLGQQVRIERLRFGQIKITKIEHGGYVLIKRKTFEGEWDALMYRPATRLLFEAFDKKERDEEVLDTVAALWWQKEKKRRSGKFDKGIIRRHLEEYEGVRVHRTVFGNFTAKFPSGRELYFNKVGIQCKPEGGPLPGEPEDIVGSLAFHIMLLSQELWGGVSFPELKGEHLEQAASVAEEGGFTVGGDNLLLQRSFGEGATAKRIFGGGLKITMKDKSVIRLSDSAIDDVSGSPEACICAMKFVQKITGQVIVRGSQKNIFTCLSHEQEAGVGEVIPEVVPSERVHMAIGGIAGPVGFLIYPIFAMSYDPAAGLSNFIIGGLVCAYAISLPISLFVEWRGRKNARRKGLELKSSFPSAAAGTRQTNVAALKKGGWVV